MSERIFCAPPTLSEAIIRQAEAMRIALVINAASGSFSDLPTPTMAGNAAAISDMIRAKLSAAGHDIMPEPDQGASLPERIAAAAAQPGIQALVVAGGDGTMACAASVIGGLAPGLVLALLPLGTMNLLARDLRLPLDLDGAIANIAAGEIRPIDIGEVNGHVFLISSVLGLPARMAQHREAKRGRMDIGGLLRFVAALLRHLGRYPKLSVSSLFAGQKKTLRVHMLAVVNNDFAERPGELLLRKSVDDGRLTLYILRHLTLWRLLRLASGMAMGDWRRLPGLERQDTDTLTIDAHRRALRVMNDGEIRLIAPPLHYRIHRRALAVIVPRRNEDVP